MELYVQALRSAAGILFDYNGTLSDDEWILEAAYDSALTEMGFEGLAPGEYDSLVGLSDPDIAKRVLASRGSEDVAGLVERLSSAYADAIEQRPTISAETAKFVRRLSQEGKEVAIITGTFRQLMQKGLEAADLAHLGERSVTIEDVQAGKPDPEGFLAGAGWRRSGEDRRFRRFPCRRRGALCCGNQGDRHRATSPGCGGSTRAL